MAQRRIHPLTAAGVWVVVVAALVVLVLGLYIAIESRLFQNPNLGDDIMEQTTSGATSPPRTLNKFLVGVVAGRVVIMSPAAVSGPMSKSDALNLAAWIVTLGRLDSSAPPLLAGDHHVNLFAVSASAAGVEIGTRRARGPLETPEAQNLVEHLLVAAGGRDEAFDALLAEVQAT